MKKMIILAAIVAVMGFYGVANADDLTATAEVNGVTAGSSSGSSSVVGDTSSGSVSGSSAVIEKGAIKFPDAPTETSVKNHGTGYRGFAEQGGVPIPGMPGYFGPATKRSRYQSAEDMTTYQDTFTLDQMTRMAKETGLDSFGSDVVVTPLVDEIAKDDRAGQIKVALIRVEGATLKGYITARATSSGTVSPELLGEVMLAARALGADAIHVSAQGAEIVLKSFGWGIGLAVTRATISNEETSGGVASGGTGISGGTAGYQDRPWIQLNAIKLP